MKEEQRQGPLMAVVKDGDDSATSREDQEAAVLARAAELEAELALTLPTDSEIRALLLRNAAAYSLASGAASRHGLRLAR